jgi:HlyD family secretion protein
MKRIALQIITVVVSVSLFSCNNNGDKSDAYGNFESDEVIVSAQMQGELKQLEIEEGQEVKEDQLVGIIDTATLSVKKDQLEAKKEATAARLTNIEAQLEVQQEQIETFETEEQRIEKLLEDGAATQQQYDNIAGKLRVARKQLKSIRTQKNSVYREMNVIDAQIREVEENMNKCMIKNPVRGTVLEKYLEKGEVALPGKAIYKIADLSTMYLRVYVSGAQLPHVKIGQEAEVLIDKDEESNQKLKGEITWISSQAEFTPKIIQTKEERVDMVYAVKVKVQNDGKIKIGMPGEVNFNEND